MFSSLVIKAIVQGVLGWLWSIYERFVQKQKDKEEGRQEVKAALDNKEKQIDEEIKKLSDTDTSFADAINELRDRANRRQDNVPRN